MTQFIAFAPNVEVAGQAVLSVVDGMGVMKVLATQMLERHGIRNPEPGLWYPQQPWLDTFREIADQVGPNTVYQIGVKIPENATFPPEIDSIEKALASIDVAYHMNHRDGEIGHYHYTKTGDRSAKMICPNPYPCEFDRGIISAMCRKFKPAEAVVYVTHDDSQACRKKGGESCTYKVSW